MNNADDNIQKYVTTVRKKIEDDIKAATKYNNWNSLE